jgi:AraC-like DNA-binding protein
MPYGAIRKRGASEVTAGRLTDAAAAEHISESASALPAAGLRRYIAGYSGYRQAGVAPAEHRGLPSPYLTVIFTLDEPLTVAEHPDPRQPADEYRTLIGGLHTVPALITHDGRQSGIQLSLSPLGARAILGLPAGELAGIDLEGSEVLGSLAWEIQERVQAATTWRERFAILDALLLERIRGDLGGAARTAARETDPEVSYAWHRLLASGGSIPISELAMLTGWSDRHLRARFAAEFGLTPKAAARVVRFDLARRQLQRRAASGRRLDLAELAARFGYYDQAHLDAEFRVIAGSAPTAWLAREFRNLQASATGGERG